MVSLLLEHKANVACKAHVSLSYIYYIIVDIVLNLH
jgi:hypothetical protein